MSNNPLLRQGDTLATPANRSREWGLVLMGIGTGVVLSATYATFAYSAHISAIMLIATTLNLVAVYLIKRNR